MRIVQVAHHVSSCRPSSLGFKFSLLAVLTPICAYERGVSGGLMVQKEGKRSGNERNGSTVQPPKSHKRLLRLLKKMMKTGEEQLEIHLGWALCHI